MRILQILAVLGAFIGWSTASAGVIEFSLNDLLRSGEKDANQSIQFVIPVSEEVPCVVASVSINIEQDEEFELFASYLVSGDLVYIDQVTVLESGDYTFDLTGGFRIAQILGLNEMTFVIESFSSSKSSGVGLFGGKKIDGQVSVSYMAQNSNQGSENSNNIELYGDSDSLTRPLVKVAIYPNPFNPNVTISLEMPRSARAQLCVFDIRGKLVKRLYTGYLGSGHRDFVWNGRNESGQLVSSGIYLYQFRSGAQISSGKMMLLK